MSLYDQYQEEVDYRFGPKLWDAGEGVCCAAYQLGGDYCHAPDEDPHDDMTREELVELYGEAEVARIEQLMAKGAAKIAAAYSSDEEPF